MKEKTAYKAAAICGMLVLNLVVFGWGRFFSGYEQGGTKLLLVLLAEGGVVALTLYVGNRIFNMDNKEEK